MTSLIPAELSFSVVPLPQRTKALKIDKVDKFFVSEPFIAGHFCNRTESWRN